MDENKLLTRKQRHKIYKSALDIYKKLITKDAVYTNGLCFAIKESIEYNKLSIDDMIIFNPYIFMETSYPELWKYKPANTGIEDYWWEENDTKTRLKVLNIIIDETK